MYTKRIQKLASSRSLIPAQGRGVNFSSVWLVRREVWVEQQLAKDSQVPRPSCGCGVSWEPD